MELTILIITPNVSIGNILRTTQKYRIVSKPQRKSRNYVTKSTRWNLSATFAMGRLHPLRRPRFYGAKLGAKLRRYARRSPSNRNILRRWGHVLTSKVFSGRHNKSKSVDSEWNLSIRIITHNVAIRNIIKTTQK